MASSDTPKGADRSAEVLMRVAEEVLEWVKTEARSEREATILAGLGSAMLAGFAAVGAGEDPDEIRALIDRQVEVVLKAMEARG